MDQISFDEFKKVEIKIGTVVKAEVPAWSHWVVRMEIDLGPSFAKASEGKQYPVCFSGIMKFYKPEDLIGRQFPFVVNLIPKKVGPEKELSEVMMLMAVPSESEETKPILFDLKELVANGTVVY